MQSTNNRLLGTTSALVLSAAAMLSVAQSANAQTAANGIYMGGSTLASEAFRQVFDCYTGKTVGNDGFSTVLPSNCTVVSTVQGMYAGVGSGNGIRGFIANAPAQWYGGTVTAGQVIPLTLGSTTFPQPPFPALQPPFVDSDNSTNFGTYPYPHVDIGLSDSPLPTTLAALTTVSFSFSPSTNWVSGATVATSQVAVGTTSVATYSTTTYGQPIQIPAFEVNVAIPLNVSGLTINSQIKNSTGTIVPGGAIQLTQAQLCAIFSGRVSDWSDTTTTIPDLDSNGNAINPTFSAANVGNGISTGQAYSANPLPIKVVFRSDGSGTSFIITNYLKTVCPLLDKNGTAGYATIFGANLPSTTFQNLITNINNTAVTSNWVGASGSGGVASAINGDTGRIGYVSSDFTKPYATSSTAPDAASLQNEDLRSQGISRPDPVSTTTLTFVAPTPDSAAAAWSDLPTAQAAWTWNDYNVYAMTYPSGTADKGGISRVGKPILALAGEAGAYPLSGTTFMNLYSCYNGAARTVNLRNFLTWYLNGSDPHVSQIVQSSGFHVLPTNYTSTIVGQYLTSGSTKLIQSAAFSQQNGCVGVTGGLNGGAK